MELGGPVGVCMLQNETVQVLEVSHSWQWFLVLYLLYGLSLWTVS